MDISYKKIGIFCLIANLIIFSGNLFILIERKKKKVKYYLFKNNDIILNTI